MKKRIIAILLLSVLFTPVLTVYLYLQFEKAAVRREIKWKMIAGMPAEELILLKFTTEETLTKLRWEHSKEFEYNGQMYDIVSKEVKGDSIFYRVWWDHEETKLNKSLKKLVAFAFDHDEENRRTQQTFHRYLGSLFCNDNFDWQAKPLYNLEVTFQNYFYGKKFHSLPLSPPSPPPKLS